MLAKVLNNYLAQSASAHLNWAVVDVSPMITYWQFHSYPFSGRWDIWQQTNKGNYVITHLLWQGYKHDECWEVLSQSEKIYKKWKQTNKKRTKKILVSMLCAGKMWCRQKSSPPHTPTTSSTFLLKHFNVLFIGEGKTSKWCV